MKYYGMIGFVDTYDMATPGIANEDIVEHPYYGEFKRQSFRNESSTQTTNDNINLNYSLSIMADQYAMDNCFNIKYVWYKKVKWKVSSVDDSNRPRLVLQLGGVFREDET